MEKEEDDVDEEDLYEKAEEEKDKRKEKEKEDILKIAREKLNIFNWNERNIKERERCFILFNRLLGNWIKKEGKCEEMKKSSEMEKESPKEKKEKKDEEDINEWKKIREAQLLLIMNDRIIEMEKENEIMNEMKNKETDKRIKSYLKSKKYIIVEEVKDNLNLIPYVCNSSNDLIFLNGNITHIGSCKFGICYIGEEMKTGIYSITFRHCGYSNVMYGIVNSLSGPPNCMLGFTAYGVGVGVVENHVYNCNGYLAGVLNDSLKGGDILTLEVDLRSTEVRKRSLCFYINSRKQNICVYGLPESIKFCVCLHICIYIYLCLCSK